MDALTLILNTWRWRWACWSRELHQTDKLIQRLEQYAANERRPQHGRTIHSNYQEEPTQPVFPTACPSVF